MGSARIRGGRGGHHRHVRPGGSAGGLWFGLGWEEGGCWGGRRGGGVGSVAADVGRAGGRRGGEQRPHRSCRSVARGPSWRRGGGGRRLPRATRVTRTRRPSRRQCCVSSGALGLRYHLAAAAPRGATAVPAPWGCPRAAAVGGCPGFRAPSPTLRNIGAVGDPLSPCSVCPPPPPRGLWLAAAPGTPKASATSPGRGPGGRGRFGDCEVGARGDGERGAPGCGSCLWGALRVLQPQLRLRASSRGAVLILPPSPQRKRLNRPRNGRAGRSPGSQTTPGLAQLPTLLSVTASPAEHRSRCDTPQPPAAPGFASLPKSRLTPPPQSLPINGAVGLESRSCGERWGQGGHVIKAGRRRAAVRSLACSPAAVTGRCVAAPSVEKHVPSQRPVLSRGATAHGSLCAPLSPMGTAPVGLERRWCTRPSLVLRSWPLSTVVWSSQICSVTRERCVLPSLGSAAPRAQSHPHPQRRAKRGRAFPAALNGGGFG